MRAQAGDGGAEGEAGGRPRWRRLWPLALMLAISVGLWWFFGEHLSFETLKAHRDALIAWRDAHFVLSVLVFLGLYALVTLFLLPGAVWLTLAGGFLFGTALGATLVVFAATLGATTIFLAVKFGFGDILRARTEGWLRRFEEGVRKNAVSFMLAIRLAPIVPFFVANAAPALLGVRTRTFAWTTFFGIIPGAAVYASVGAGLDEIIARGEEPDMGVIFEWPVLGPLLGLAALALLPVGWRMLQRRRERAG